MFDLRDALLPLDISEEHIEVIFLLLDAVVHETTAENIAPYLDDGFPKDKIHDYLREYSRPSRLKGLKEYLIKQVTAESMPSESQRQFRFFATALQSRLMSPLLTNSFTMIKDMSLEERENLVKSWRDSPLEFKRKLYSTIVTLAQIGFGRFATDLHYTASGYPGRDVRESLYEEQPKSEFRYQFMEKPISEGHNLSIPNVDVLIIGSGSGSGVVANTLSEKGHKCLVLEKGKYYHESEYTFDEQEGTTLYESEGVLSTTDQSLFMWAGSTFGGGSTVNWSACLKTPFKVRKEWYDIYGLEWAATEKYDQCMDYVWKKMGASSENLNHSLANQVILEGGKKLGYAVREIAQNNGGHPSHDCGFCYLGCKHGIKQGSHAFWFREASENGCQFMDQVKVLSILHKDGVATGVLCQNSITNTKFTITGPKKFIVCGGSLQTPVLLQNSGFKNKNIGKNLKLHPATAVMGDFGKEVKSEPHYHPIMTTVCTEKDDLDGKAHGAKVETILHAPSIISLFMPWCDSESTRRNSLKFNSLSALLILSRDTTSGSVRADPLKPDALVVDYYTNKADRNNLLEASLIAADMLYIQGAKEIFAPQSPKLTFKSSKSKESRSITDKDYVEFRNKIAKWPIRNYETRLASAHQMSSCRMSGKGPANGACDTKGRLFECKNIYIADASTMPTASGANPMISTMAIARLVATGIAKDLEPRLKL